MTSAPPDKPVDSRRLTVRLPADLCEALDALVEEGQFPHRSAVIRTALRRLTTATDVHVRSLDVYLARRLADEADWTVEFNAREVAPALHMTPQQVAQAIHAHRELENPLVEIEQGSTDTHGSIRWQVTPRGALPLLAATDPDEKVTDS
jgi:Arc/MetJ-type ribon-helix-helix transcriptional regulator